MKKGYFIMYLSKIGNIGAHEIQKLEANPKDGYFSYEEAETQMFRLKEQNHWQLNMKGYCFTIMELFW